MDTNSPESASSSSSQEELHPCPNRVDSTSQHSDDILPPTTMQQQSSFQNASIVVTKKEPIQQQQKQQQQQQQQSSGCFPSFCKPDPSGLASPSRASSTTISPGSCGSSTHSSPNSIAATKSNDSSSWSSHPYDPFKNPQQHMVASNSCYGYSSYVQASYDHSSMNSVHSVTNPASSHPAMHPVTSSQFVQYPHSTTQVKNPSAVIASQPNYMDAYNADAGSERSATSNQCISPRIGLAPKTTYRDSCMANQNIYNNTYHVTNPIQHPVAADLTVRKNLYADSNGYYHSYDKVMNSPLVISFIDTYLRLYVRLYSVYYS